MKLGKNHFKGNLQRWCRLVATSLGLAGLVDASLAAGAPEAVESSVIEQRKVLDDRVMAVRLALRVSNEAEAGSADVEPEVVDQWFKWPNWNNWNNWPNWGNWGNWLNR